jgi:hypothetical protein
MIRCPICLGNGKIDNPAFSNGITESERDEMGDESFQNYVSGVYDVKCPCCQGLKMVSIHQFIEYKMELRDSQQYAYEREFGA